MLSPQQVILELMVMCGKSGKVIKVYFVVGAGTEVRVLGAPLHMKQGQVPFVIEARMVYCTRQAHKSPHNPGKRPNKESIVNVARSWCGARFPWTLKSRPVSHG